MKGYGNGFGTLLKKCIFYLIPTSGGRTKFIYRHAAEFKKLGVGVFWQPRYYPADPELISIGNNVLLAANVSFINHDIIADMLNRKLNTLEFKKYEGCIQIGDNVVIGSGTRILPDVKIGSNVIIGSGSVVTKDIPDNSVAAGVPCRVVGDFDKIVAKYRRVNRLTPEELWKDFEIRH